MSSSQTTYSFAESIEDIKISWYLLKQNWKAFLGTSLFAFFAMLVAILGFAFSLMIIDQFYPVPSFHEGRGKLSPYINPFTLTLSYLIFLAFLSCQYGLAYDVISSGDMFAEFKGAITYFRLHWRWYPLLTAMIGWFHLLFMPQRAIMLVLSGREDEFPNIDLPLAILLELFALLLHYTMFLLFINTLPSITAQGNLKQSFRDNFAILRKIPKRMVVTWGLFFLIFLIPSFFFSSISVLVGKESTSSTWWALTAIFSVGGFVLGIIIGAPIMSLIATRIYNNIVLNEENND